MLNRLNDLPSIEEVQAEIKRRMAAQDNQPEILTRALAKLDNAQASGISQYLGMNPFEFANTVLGRYLWTRQTEILESVQHNARTAVRSCHGIGKTYTAAIVILWFLYTYPHAIVLSTAPTWRQVDKLIWKEVRTAFNNSLLPLNGNLQPKAPELHLIHNAWYAAGISTNTPDRFQGFHEEHVLIVVDEAAGVSEDIFEALEGILTSKGARLLLLGNPTAIGGSFYNAFKSAEFAKIHVSAFDTPNFTQFGITPEDIFNNTFEDKIADAELPNARLITPSWVRSRYLEWGTDSPAWSSRILGNFPEQAEDTLIPLIWIELAMERWADVQPRERDFVQIGVDVARYGSDRTVIATRRGRKVTKIDVYAKQSTMETAGLAKRAYLSSNADAMSVDEIGVGSGVVDALEEDGIFNVGVNVADPAKDPERFANLRAELWWNLRERLNPDEAQNPDPIALPSNDALLAELSSVKYKITRRGAIQIEAKEDLKKRLGRSPDIADAVVLAFARSQEKGFISSGGKTFASRLF